MSTVTLKDTSLWRDISFFTRNQEAGERFDKYLAELKILEKTCDFGRLLDSLIRDRIVCGIDSSSLRERL